MINSQQIMLAHLELNEQFIKLKGDYKILEDQIQELKDTIAYYENEMKVTSPWLPGLIS